jgi:hypothetical protein
MQKNKIEVSKVNYETVMHDYKKLEKAMLVYLEEEIKFIIKEVGGKAALSKCLGKSKTFITMRLKRKDLSSLNEIYTLSQPIIVDREDEKRVIDRVMNTDDDSYNYFKRKYLKAELKGKYLQEERAQVINNFIKKMNYDRWKQINGNKHLDEFFHENDTYSVNTKIEKNKWN